MDVSRAGVPGVQVSTTILFGNIVLYPKDISLDQNLFISHNRWVTCTVSAPTFTPFCGQRAKEEGTRGLSAYGAFSLLAGSHFTEKSQEFLTSPDTNKFTWKVSTSPNQMSICVTSFQDMHVLNRHFLILRKYQPSTGHIAGCNARGDYIFKRTKALGIPEFLCSPSNSFNISALKRQGPGDLFRFPSSFQVHIKLCAYSGDEEWEFCWDGCPEYLLLLHWPDTNLLFYDSALTYAICHLVGWPYFWPSAYKIKESYNSPYSI